MIPINNPIELFENKRTYIYPKGTKIIKPDGTIIEYPKGHIIEIENVIELIVRNSDNHRIRTKEGKLYIILTGYTNIKIEPLEGESWTI